MVDCTCVDDKLKNPAIPEVEVYPDCEHRLRVENPDGSEYCWICGITLTESK